MTTFKKLLRPISALSVLALGSALSFTVAAATPAPEFDIQGKPDFVKSLGEAANTKIERSTEETKRLIADVYNDKLEQHVMSKHFEKGLTCVTCHDQQRQGRCAEPYALSQGCRLHRLPHAQHPGCEQV